MSGIKREQGRLKFPEIIIKEDMRNQQRGKEEMDKGEEGTERKGKGEKAKKGGNILCNSRALRNEEPNSGKSPGPRGCKPIKTGEGWDACM